MNRKQKIGWIFGAVFGALTIYTYWPLYQQRHSGVPIDRLAMGTIKSAVQHFWTQCERIPTKEEGLDVLLSGSPENCKFANPTLAEPVLTEMPVNQWKMPFVYEPTSASTFLLKSLGKDDREGGEGDDIDVVLEMSLPKH